MADEYDIYVRGFAPGTREPERALSRVFGIEIERARELVISLPRVVKRRLSAEQVVRYELALRHVRADYELRKSPLRPSYTAIVGDSTNPDANAVAGHEHGSTLTLPPPAHSLPPTPSLPPAQPLPGTEPPPPEQPQPPPPTSTATDDLPPPWEVPGLDFTGRPNWLVSAPSAHDAGETDASSVRGPAPSARVGASGSRSRALPPSGHTYRVGVAPNNASKARSPLPRLALALAIGASLAMVAIGVGRHFGWIERGALPRLPGVASADGAPAVADDDPLMPVALDWAQSDLHQFSNGDKERVRALVHSFLKAGAREVRASHISPNGQLQIAAELVIVLPSDPADRKAVFGEYETFLRAAFGDFVAPPKDDGSELLRVAL